MSAFVLSIDQGTTSSRAIIYDAQMRPIASSQREFPQIFPASGWVEHDPEAIWQSVIGTARTALEKAAISPRSLASIGVTNQRETVVVWERDGGKPIYNAIVWQDRRTESQCEALRQEGIEETVAQKTGLLLDPYFSATKIGWILDHVEGARARAENGELLAGTIDSFVIWRLTGGTSHVTDATNAARTLLYDINADRWDEDLGVIFNVPLNIMPEVFDCAAHFGLTCPELLGAAVPVLGVAGDQQAAAIGQACFAPGTMKATYGTGCFVLLNTGRKAVRSHNRLLTTVAYRLGGQNTYALEGSIFVAGAAVQWLRDELNVIENAAEADGLARKADPEQNVFLVPAFVGLGAPHWDSSARGAIFGLTRNSGGPELTRAALESVAYQTHDLLETMWKDWPGNNGESALRVDGGMVASDWTMQCLADILNRPVDRARVSETTALGAAWLAGSQAGIWPGMEAFAENWALDRRFSPSMDEAGRQQKIAGWRDAVRRTLSR